MLADGGDTVLPANPLQRGLLAPLRLCRRWQNPDRCPPGGDTGEVGQCYEVCGWAPLLRRGRGGSGSPAAVCCLLDTRLAERSLGVSVERQRGKRTWASPNPQGRGK